MDGSERTACLEKDLRLQDFSILCCKRRVTDFSFPTAQYVELECGFPLYGRLRLLGFPLHLEEYMVGCERQGHCTAEFFFPHWKRGAKRNRSSLYGRTKGSKDKKNITCI